MTTHPTIADTHRATALAALRIATEHAAAGRPDHARAFRGTAVSSIALLADASRRATGAGVRERGHAVGVRRRMRGDAGVSAKPWTEAHRREALRRTYELAAEAAGAPRSKAVAWWMVEQGDSSDHEMTWRAMLGNAGMGGTRVDREVRRVRGLAEGRFARETTWRGQSGEVLSCSRSLSPTRATAAHRSRA